MLPYFMLLFVPGFFSIISLYKVPRSIETKRKIIDVFFIIWLILLCFRSSKIGIDLSVYKYHFINFSKMSWFDIFEGIVSFEFEASFAIISKFVSVFTNDFHVVISLCALLSVIPIWLLYRKEVYNPMLLIVIFLNVAPFPLYFSGLRQALAIAFIVPCYYCCKNNDIKKFILTVFVAFFIHNSALILIIMYPIYHMRINKKSVLFLILPSVGILYANSIPVFKFLLSFFQGKYFDRYESGIGSTGAYAVLMLLIVFLIFSFMVVKNNELDDDTIGLRNLLIVSVFLQVFANAHTLSMRLNYYYLMFVPLLISKIVSKGSDKQRTIILLGVLCMLAFFTFYFFYGLESGSANKLNIYPYEFLFIDY